MIYIVCEKESLIGKEAFFDSFSTPFHINMKKVCISLKHSFNKDVLKPPLHPGPVARYKV